jgi:hypothetical protein
MEELVAPQDASEMSPASAVDDRDHSTSSPSARPRIVGRERELEVLAGGLEAARTGTARLFVLTGEAGIGKTRLADAFADRARADGVRVVWGRCWEAGGAPEYWPWVQVLRACLREAEAVRPNDARDPLRTILPELGPVSDAPRAIEDPERERFVLFNAIAATLRTVADAAGLVVVLDDLHAADEPSLLLLRFLGGELADARILFVAIYREPELDSQDPRQVLLADLARDAIGSRIRPGPLSQPEIAALVTVTTGEAPTSALVEAIARETEGNPLFVAEVARLLMEEGRLSSVDAPDWRLAIPEGVKAVIGRRLDRLSRECRSILQLTSVLGREFGLELVEELGASQAEVLAAIDEASAARIVQEGRRGLGRWRFAHVLIRDVLYESLSLPIRLGLHDRVGRALERLAGDQPDAELSELAHHFVLAAPGGDVSRAVRYSTLAGHRASVSAAHEEAVRHHRNALAALELDRSADEATRCRLLLSLGEAERRAGMPQARATLMEVGAQAARLGLSEELARAAVAYGGPFLFARPGPDRDLIPFLTKALAAREGMDDALRVRLLARLSGALRSEPDVGPRDAMSAEAIELARRLGEPAALSFALEAREMAITGPDTLEEVERLHRERAAIVFDTKDPAVAGIARGWSALNWVNMVGRPVSELEALVERTADSVEPLRQPAQLWYLGVLRTVLALAAGRFDSVEQLIRETREAGRRGIDWDAEFSYRLSRFALERERGDLENVLPMLRNADNDLPGYWLPRAALAYVEASTGRLDDARRHLEPLSRHGYTDLPKDNQWLWAMIHIGEALILLDDSPGIEQVLALLRPYQSLAATAASEVIGGPVGRVVGDLAATLGQFDVAEEAYAAGLELVKRTGWRPWEAWTHLSIGRMLMQRDRPRDRERAREHLAQASTIAQELGMTTLQSRLAEVGHAAVAAMDSVTPSATAEPYALRREGDVWAITYEGRTTRIRDSKGVGYLAVLLASPGREAPAIDLVAGPGSIGGSTYEDALAIAGGAADPILDPVARTEYRTRLRELHDEVEEAERMGDAERASALRAEFEFLSAELSAAIGLAGRPRGQVSEAERARQSVTKAIRLAIDRIARHDRRLAEHLRHSVRTGIMCLYAPDPHSPISWRVRDT